MDCITSSTTGAAHLPGFPDELDELAKHHIQLDGVWFPDGLNADARFILDNLAKHNVKTQLWVNSGGYDQPTQEARVAAAVERMGVVAVAAGKIGCTLCVYNHGGWFGEAENQIAIVQGLKAAGVENVGIVYNLHHAFAEIDRFDELFPKLLPYLVAVNLNGMSKIPASAGEPVVPVGQGELDVHLLKTIRDSGFSGPIGIINESNEDAEGRLLDNLDGIRWILPQLDGAPPGDRPEPRTWTPPGKAKAAAAAPSMSPEFGKALAGEMLVDGKPEYKSPPITVECWALLHSKTGYNILLASDTKASAAHWEIFTSPGGGALAAYMPGYSPDLMQSEVPICDGKWHYIAMQFEPERVRLYVERQAGHRHAGEVEGGNPGSRSPGIWPARGRGARLRWADR